MVFKKKVLHFILFTFMPFSDEYTWSIRDHTPVETSSMPVSASSGNSKADNNFTVEHLIESHGYPVETHHLTTSDGYILTIHRIPHGRTNISCHKKIVFLQHGLFVTSADWLMKGTKSLGYTLADEGYDVWMGNTRGTTYSRKHIKLNPDYDEFWQFSWHEMGIIDVPQMIDYVLEQTGSDQLSYVGYSQGTTIFYAMTSSLPEYNNKIKVAVHFSPIAFINHLHSPLIRIISRWNGPLERLLDMIGKNEFLPNRGFLQRLIGDLFCGDDDFTQKLCTIPLFVMAGFTKKQMNTTLLPLLLRFVPAGASTDQLLHYAQGVVSGKFCQYDHSKQENMAIYGQEKPPEYDLARIRVPTYLFYSKNDWVSAPADVDRLCSAMKEACKEKIMVSDPKWNHLDYMYGIHAHNLVYNKCVSILAQY